MWSGVLLVVQAIKGMHGAASIGSSKLATQVCLEWQGPLFGLVQDQPCSAGLGLRGREL